jgi:2-iminoacetate synthase ThiH
MGGSQVMLQGGLHPTTGLEKYWRRFVLQGRHSLMFIHAFSHQCFSHCKKVGDEPH